MQYNENNLTEENERLRKEIIQLQLTLKDNIYETLFHTSPDVIIQVDTAYKIILIHVPEIPKDRLEKLKGADVFSVTPPTLHDKMRAALEKVFLLGETVSYESEADAMGKYRHYLNYITPMKDDAGRTYSAYFVSREMTELKNAEKVRRDSEKKLSALFGSSQHLHLLMDNKGALVWFNQRAMDTSRTFFRKELTVGEGMINYLPGKEYRDSFAEYFKRTLTGETVVFPRHYVIDGNHVYLEMMLQAIYEDDDKKNMIGISLVGVETTDRRANEAKLEKINKELLQHNQQLNQYSFIISHNLRGPIVTLLGLVNLFEQSHSDAAFKEEIISHIKRSTLHLDSIVLDLNMILSQSDGNELVLSDINLLTELNMVEDLLKSQMEFAKATIHHDFSAITAFRSVRSYVQSIFMNLITNSIKYKKHNQPAVIKITSSRIEDNMVRIDFEDNGIGFDIEKHSDALYGFYKRFHTHVEGKGLGLHLVKTQVDLLSGKVEVKSEVNKGTTFSIFLPIN